MVNETSVADHNRTIGATEILPDDILAELSPYEQRAYFKPCLDALDWTQHAPAASFAPRIQTKERKGVVYFIRGAGGAIKIGFTVRSVKERTIEYQAGSPVPLTLLATREGWQTLEAEYHRHFAAHRLHGEWFAPHPDILAEITRLTAPHCEERK